MTFLKQFTADYAAHTTQVETLLKTVTTLREISLNIPVETHASLSFIIQRVQVRHFLNGINELNATICHALSQKFSTPAEALSRVSIEMSVNLLFILAKTQHARSKGLLRACVEARKSRAKKWYKFAAGANLVTSMKAAEGLLQSTELIEKSITFSPNLPIAPWPSNSREKFKAVGKEEVYCTHFQSSSDSVHLLGEDILNSTIVEFIPTEDHARAFALLDVEKFSFAIYLTIQAILCHCEAIHILLELIGSDEKLSQEVQQIANKIGELHSLHESDHERYFSSK
ncbi:hypothetical protein DBR37_03320 [Herminiimonas sp. KBW02]|uniref:DUF5677 domain-containing protein n=1 Tax=Herminiimonas sp. KBW02 TaxID=2153363 RepID=UPI000F5A89D6|nr:DUF5677 domain-containing protein [Herminiimonas sp. KBW02]RQO37233.1 hypothetical protein DBR37_03320 [Herminiimonas sp. KBW02]